MQPQTLGWVAAAALLVGAVVRLLKTDMLTIALANLGLPPIPKRVLPWVSLVLGVGSSILDVKLQGTDWPSAIAKGLVAGVAAIAGHELGVESARKGKELLAIGCVFFMTTTITGCAFLRAHAKDALDVAQIGCIIANQFQPDSKVAEICQIADDYFEPMQKVLADARKKSDEVAAQTAESTRAGTCGKRLEP